MPHEKNVCCNDTVRRSLPNYECHSANSVSPESHSVYCDLSDLSVQSKHDFLLKCSDISYDSSNYLCSNLSDNSTCKYDGYDCVSFERPVIVSNNDSVQFKLYLFHICGQMAELQEILHYIKHIK